MAMIPCQICLAPPEDTIWADCRWKSTEKASHPSARLQPLSARVIKRVLGKARALSRSLQRDGASVCTEDSCTLLGSVIDGIVLAHRDTRIPIKMKICFHIETHNEPQSAVDGEMEMLWLYLLWFYLPLFSFTFNYLWNYEVYSKHYFQFCWIRCNGKS